MHLYASKNIHTQTHQKNISVLVAQLDRVSASEAEGRGFDSRQAHHLIKTLDNASVFCVSVIIYLAIIINLNNFNPISIWVFDKGDVFHRTLFRTLFKFYAIFIKPSNRVF